MKEDFRVGDFVEWNSEAGHVRGTIKKKITSPITFKGYTVRASREEPQYQIKSAKTNHLAVHKGSALKKLSKTNPRAKRVGRRSNDDPSSSVSLGGRKRGEREPFVQDCWQS